MSIFRPEIRRLPVRPGLVLAILGTSGCIAGEIRDHHASVVESYLPTPFLDSKAPYADPSRALGPPDGRTVALGTGASITLRFFRVIPNGPGPDLRVIEVGPDGARARVAVSPDGERFHELAAPASDNGTTEVELDEPGLDAASFVRLRGVDDKGLDPGFDLDAVEALQ